MRRQSQRSSVKHKQRTPHQQLIPICPPVMLSEYIQHLAPIFADMSLRGRRRLVLRSFVPSCEDRHGLFLELFLIRFRCGRREARVIAKALVESAERQIFDEESKAFPFPGSQLSEDTEIKKYYGLSILKKNIAGMRVSMKQACYKELPQAGPRKSRDSRFDVEVWQYLLQIILAIL
jgi:hypothetical protein